MFISVNFIHKKTVGQKEKEAKRKRCGNMENSTEFTTFPHPNNNNLFINDFILLI